MALNPNSLKFLLEQIKQSDIHSFSSTIGQLVNYLDKEVKDNPVYEQYESNRRKWHQWINQHMMSNWQLPHEYEEAKSLAYEVYRATAVDGDSVAHGLFRDTNRNENISKLNHTFFGHFVKAMEDIINANPEIDVEKPTSQKGNVVFIVHGHDNELKRELQLLLKNAGVNNIVLHEIADKGRTIIDKLFEETHIAGYAVALLTPDDLTTGGNPRARQNVILEIGYFLGKIGKERIRMIVKENIEIPSDLSGILYEKYDAHGAWKIKLLKEIQAVGIYVNLQNAVSSF